MPDIKEEVEEEPDLVISLEAEPEPFKEPKEEVEALFSSGDRKGRLSFATFDLNLLTSSPANFLMASEAKVFEAGGPSGATGTLRKCPEDPASQRAAINKR